MTVLPANEENPKKRKNDKRYESSFYNDLRAVGFSPPIPQSSAELASSCPTSVSSPQVPHIYNDHNMLDDAPSLERMGAPFERSPSPPPAVSITQATPEPSPRFHAAESLFMGEALRLSTPLIAGSSSSVSSRQIDRDRSGFSNLFPRTSSTCSTASSEYQEFVFDSRSDHSGSHTSLPSFDPNPSRASGRRGPLSEWARVEMNAVKKMGACWRCKFLRKNVCQKRLKLRCRIEIY
jgi:hypothetical protein